MPTLLKPDKEQMIANPKVHGQIPLRLEGMYIRNGTNQKHASSGKMHMFDGDAMLHCVKLSGGKADFYANSWIQTRRYKNNEASFHADVISSSQGPAAL